MIFGQTKQKYGFILGNCPALSGVEIKRVWAFLGISFETIFSNNQVLIIETKSALKIDEIQERLGGTVKISCITYHVSLNQNKFGLGQARIKLNGTIRRLIKDRRPPSTTLGTSKTEDRKYQFGFSVYGKVNVKELQRIGLEIKRDLKEQGIKSRFVVSKEPALSSVIVQKEKLIEQGVDVVIVQADGQYYIGYTVAVQKFAEYSQRDYGRPSRDDKSGLLPPKLAKMMLNVSQTDFNQVILDPFCGSGTIIQEALLLGYKNIIGSDISEKAVSDSQNNIEWLKTKLKVDVSGVKIYQLDARELTEMIEEGSVDCIVTEPYLGPARSSSNRKYYERFAGVAHATPANLSIIRELAELYIKSFEEFYKVLKKEGNIVIILPIIEGQRLEILEGIKGLGFAIDMLSNELRGSLIYSRPGQRVEREIFIFKKVRT